MVESLDDKTIDKETVAKVEAEIRSKQAEELRKLSDAKAVEIEARVRQEMSERAEKEAQAKKLVELENQNKQLKEEMDAKMKSDREAFEKRLQELENTKKAIADTKSPFAEEKKPNMVKGIDVDKLDLVETERLSKEAFKQHFRLPADWGEKR